MLQNENMHWTTVFQNFTFLFQLFKASTLPPLAGFRWNETKLDCCLSNSGSKSYPLAAKLHKKRKPHVFVTKKLTCAQGIKRNTCNSGNAKFESDQAARDMWQNSPEQWPKWKKIWHYPTTNCSSKLYLIFAFEFSTRPNFCRPLGRHKFLPFEQQCPCT